ncbi:hypothetical protein EJ02DRAFT_405997 [Clathrospora elynae]|uniref:Transcriptional co-activator n=1 Tax=Clathrospora elynae TaxID=706981 RepID=A0A6A5SMQ1_9PLEO|nr:hypothetical protein EJ02DRAFT_405997 [Clathrospora elynae]
MAGTIRPNDMNVSTTPTLASTALPALQTDIAKKASAPRTPRIDVEPLYSAVKGAISDADWTMYKKALSFFLLGNLNQEELSFKLAKILTTPALEHAHNALVTAIYANIWRDPPEPGIATWVSSSDKPSSGTIKGTGDESEKRLKHEVMQLSRRERKRLKTIPAGDGLVSVGQDGVSIGVGVSGPVQEYVDARRGKQLEVGPSSIQGGGGFGKTNWDLEIRKRYTSALYAETLEFPTATTISYRLLPICYEFGLPQGHTPDCPDYLNIATETYIKEALASLLGKVGSNGPGYVRTGDFKKKVEREERLVERGDLVRGSGGELPVEAEERRKRKLLCMEDLRLGLEIGDSYLAQTPLIAGSIVNSRFLDTHGIEEMYDPPLKPLTNGVNGTAVNGIKHELNGETWTIDVGDPMLLDDDYSDMNWQGGSVQDVADLDDALDHLLNLGDQ